MAETGQASATHASLLMVLDCAGVEPAQDAPRQPTLSQPDKPADTIADQVNQIAETRLGYTVGLRVEFRG